MKVLTPTAVPLSLPCMQECCGGWIWAVQARLCMLVWGARWPLIIVVWAGMAFCGRKLASMSRNGSEGLQHMFIDTDHYSHASSK